MPLPPGRLIAVMLTVALLPNAAQAAEPLPLPSPQPFEVLVDSVQESAADPLWQCSPSAGAKCDCVTFGGEQWQMHWSGVERVSGSVRAENIVLAYKDERIRGEGFEVQLDGDTPVLTFASGAWTTGDLNSQTLQFRRATVRPADDSVKVEFDDPVWRRGREAIEFSTGCDGEELDADVEDGLDMVVGPRRAAAQRLYFADNDWHVDRLKLEGALRPRLSSGLTAGDRTAGLLPPSLRMGPDGVRITGETHLGDVPVGLRSHFDTGTGVGVGAAYWSSSPLCESTPCRTERISVDGFANSDGLSAGHLSGEIGTGTPRRHAVANTDGLSWTDGEGQPGMATLVDRGALFRDWSAQRAGISISSEQHDLLITGTHLAEGQGGFEPGQAQPWALDVGVKYGTHIDLGTPGQADLRVRHRELNGSQLQSLRLSSLDMGLQKMYGTTRRAYVRPALQAQMAMGVFNDVDGAIGGSRAHVDAYADGGLALRGHWPSLTHTITPRGLVGRRIVADDAVPAQLRDVDVGGSAVTGHSFNFMGVSTGQRFAWPGRGIFRIPIGVVFFDQGEGREWSGISHATLEWGSHHLHRPVVIGVDGQCVRWCDRYGGRGRLQVGWTERLESVTSVGWMAADPSGMLSFDRQLRGGTGMWFAGADDGLQDDSAVHASALRGRWTQWRAQLRYFGDVREPSESGLEALVEHRWPEIGWGIGLRAAALPHRDLWAATVGLSTSPVF